MKEYERMEESLRERYETSVKQLDDYMNSSDKIDGVTLPDLIDIVNDVIKSKDEVCIHVKFSLLVYFIYKLARYYSIVTLLEYTCSNEVISFHWAKNQFYLYNQTIQSRHACTA
jgi:hypothetical protein